MRQTEVRFGKDYNTELERFLGRSRWEYTLFTSGTVQPIFDALIREGSPEILVLLQPSEYSSFHRVYLFNNNEEFRAFLATFHQIDPETGRKFHGAAKLK